MNDERRKALNKYLGEPYTTSEYTVANSGDLVSVRTVIQNRTFTTDADMMALYRAIHREGKSKSEDFMRFMMDRNPDKYYNFQYDYIQNFNGWLFCLSGEGYEERCKMVAEFYGWEDR